MPLIFDPGEAYQFDWSHEYARLAGATTTLDKTSADWMVAAVFAAVGDSLAKGEPVPIAGFGIFTTKSRPARQGRSPRTGEAIAASTAPAFKPGKALRDTVNAGAA